MSNQKFRVVALAEFIISVKSVSTETLQHAVKVVADAVGVASGGYKLPGSRVAKEVCVKSRDERHTIWFDREEGPLGKVVFANTMAIVHLDWDDGHRAAAGHAGGAIVAAVFAEVENKKVSTERVLIAIVIGVEIAVRVAAAVIKAAKNANRKVDTYISSRWVGYGVCAAIGWLRRLDVNTLAHAMALTGATAPHMKVGDYTHVGNHTKEGIPWATEQAFSELERAQCGMQGPLDILDHETFDGEILAKRDGGWYIETTYFKLYTCCRYIHPLIDAIIKIKALINEGDEVIHILAETFEDTFRLNNQIDPDTVQAAIYASPFCVAAAEVHGPTCLMPISEDLLKDPKVLERSKQVGLKVDDRLSPMFPDAVPGRVTVMTKQGKKYVEEVLAPKGEPSNPLTWEEHMEKAQRIAQLGIGGEAASSLIKSLQALRDEMDIMPLFKCLGLKVLV